MENFRCFHDKLSEEEVYASFINIIQKSKKFAKIEFKVDLLYYLLLNVIYQQCASRLAMQYFFENYAGYTSSALL